MILNAIIFLRCYAVTIREQRKKRTNVQSTFKECNKIFRFIFPHVELKVAHNASNEFHANVLSKNSICRIKSAICRWRCVASLLKSEWM